MARKLYVGNLPFSAGEAELQELFGTAGTVDSVKVMRDMATGRARGFAFVEMANDDDAQKAIDKLHNFEFGGRNLTVNEARPASRAFGRLRRRRLRWWRRRRWRRRLRRRRRRRQGRPARAPLVKAFAIDLIAARNQADFAPMMRRQRAESRLSSPHHGRSGRPDSTIPPPNWSPGRPSSATAPWRLPLTTASSATPGCVTTPASSGSRSSPASSARSKAPTSCC